MEEKLKIKDWERDLVFMQNEFKIIDSKGDMITRKYDILVFGRHNDLPYSAVSLLVSLPCAVTAQLILDGKIKERGVLRPVSHVIIENVLKKVNLF
jgi:saccharopine dehydrogenase (NADP+, L-glutamate forming)